MSKVLIIGGLGFIGSNLVFDLSKDHEVVVLDANVNYFYPQDVYSSINLKFRYENYLKNCVIENLNSLNINQLRDKLEEINPEYIVNLGALPLAKNAIKNTEDAFDNIIITAKNICEIIKKNTMKTKYIHISSSMIYGDFEKNPNPENATKEPKEIYGSFKYASEKIVLGYSKMFGIKTNIIRPTAVYGPTDNNKRIISKFIMSAFKNEEILANNPENNYLDFTYIDDVVQGIKKVMFSETVNGEAFNLSFGKARSIMELIEIIRVKFPNLKFKSEKYDSFYPIRGSLDVSKLKKIGYSPKFNLEEGIDKYIQFCKENYKL